MYFNNCGNRKHQEIYGADAFYDLNTVGGQAKMATNLRPGDICIVASYEDKKKTIVKMSWYKFLSDRLADDNSGTLCRVLCGEFQESEIILKTEAAKDERYSSFFTKAGSFKRPSVTEKVL